MPDVEYLNHNVLLLYNNYFIFRATWKFEWMFMENWIIHSSMTFQMKFILKEAIYSLSSFSFTSRFSKALKHDAFELKMHFHEYLTRNIRFRQT